MGLKMPDLTLEVGVYNTGTQSIDWINRYEYADILNLRITDSLGTGTDSATWSMRFDPAFTSSNELPLSGQIVRIKFGTEVVFKGVITTINNVWANHGQLVGIQCSAESEMRLLDRHLVVGEYPEQRVDVRIKSILNDFASNFANDLSKIERGPYVPEATYDYQSVSSIISELARNTMRIWDLNYDRSIVFKTELDTLAPVSVLDLDSNIEVGDVEISTDPIEANVIIIKDFASKSKNKLDHEVTGDGRQAFFKLPMPPFDVDSTEVYVKPEGSDSWTQYNVVPDPLDGSNESVYGNEKVAMVCVFNQGIRFPTGSMPQAGDAIKTRFNPEIPDRVTVVFDEDSIRECARREGTDGYHEMVISASDFRVESDNPIMMLGELILRRTAWPIVTGSMRIMDASGWYPGQKFTLYSEMRDIYDVKKWVQSDYSIKNPVTVYVTSVERAYIPTNNGIIEEDRINFSSYPWET